ncbi:MAG: metallophosphoesterase [Gemmatimonadales bacterium]
MTTLVHLSDLHFGRDVDLEQVRALEAGMPGWGPDAIVISGDLTQRSRHGELLCALGFVERLRKLAPTLVIPGNHDVEWWLTPLDVAGPAVRSWKYRHYFGEDLSPGLELPGLSIASVLTSHGVTWKSLTWKFWRDTAVKGHLPLDQIRAAEAVFRRAPAGALKVLVLHHNVLRGRLSRRMGLARWREAQRRIVASGAELVLCGHDHEEGVALLDDKVVIATAGTHTSRTRGGRPSAFNLIQISEREIRVEPQVWDRQTGRFLPGLAAGYPR